MLTMFVALTFVKMLAPHNKLNGAAYKVEIGIVQVEALII